MSKSILFFVLLISINAPAQTVKRYDIVITEIMADPTPPVGLPNAEFVEIQNRSAFGIDLFGWKLSDGTSTASFSSHIILQPDSLLIVCANSNVSALSALGRTAGLSSFPSLDNDGDVILLRSNTFLTVHAVNYEPDWYTVESKKDGGWALEMIDPDHPCGGKENWKASISNAGGTPGKRNSVRSVIADVQPPDILRTISPDSSSILLFFDEILDSVSASQPNYEVTGIQVNSIRCIPPLFNSVLLRLSAPMQKDKPYTVKVSEVKDCKGNMGAGLIATAGIPSAPVTGDLYINEILFDPVPSGYDFVEIFNCSSRIVDLGQLSLANRDGNGALANTIKLSPRPFLLFPGMYHVFTEDTISLAMQFLVKDRLTVLDIVQMPSYPDDKGSVVLLDMHGNIIDEVSYSKDWQFALIDNAEGISLERIGPGNSSSRSNWHSAASTAGYGTPGYQNSQFRAAEQFEAAINIYPRLFSPNSDGKDDFLTIEYELEEQGFVGNIFVFDTKGRLVHPLVQNDLLAFRGKWKWDGLNAARKKLATGTYILLIEFFDLKGRRKRWKEAVVIAP